MKMNVIKRAVALSLFLFAFSSAFASWNLNDVSYLMPLPEKFDGSDGLLRMYTPAKGGQLLPEIGRAHV